MCKVCFPIPDQTYVNSTLSPFCILLLQFLSRIVSFVILSCFHLVTIVCKISFAVHGNNNNFA